MRREDGRGRRGRGIVLADSIETRVVRNKLGPGMQPGACSAEHELDVSVRGMARGNFHIEPLNSWFVIAMNGTLVRWTVFYAESKMKIKCYN